MLYNSRNPRERATVSRICSSTLPPQRRPSRGRLASAGLILPLAASLTLLSACHSGGSSSSGGSLGSLVDAPPPLPAQPLDIPTAAPQCTGSTSVTVTVPAELSGYVSACESQAGDEVVITNLSQDVFNVIPAGNAEVNLKSEQYDSSADLLPSEDELEAAAQSVAVDDLRPPGDSVFLSVGGQVVATASQPFQVYVQYDPDASATSFAAGVMSGYVVESLIRALPEDSVASYTASVANCVNAAFSLWNQLTSQQPPSAKSLVLQALQTYAACGELQKKMAADPDVEHPGSDGLEPDLGTAAQDAGQQDWQSESTDADNIDLEIR
jgi:hypothetical protein